MRILSPLGAALFLAVIASSPARAQEKGEPVYRMKTIVVTAARTEQRLEDVPANVTVLTREDVERSAAVTLDDLLRRVPGFSLLRQSSSRMSSPTTQSVSLRGLGGTSASRTLVLLDGVPLTDPFGGWVYWSRVPLESIERIEIVRGGVAGVWGNLALGGVIQIFTRPPEERAPLDVSAGAGSLGTVNTRAAGAGRAGALVLSGDASYFHTDGYEVIREDLRGLVDTLTGSEHVDVGGRLDFLLSPDSRVYVAGGYFDEDRTNETAIQLNSTNIGYLNGGAHFVRPGGSEWSVTGFSSVQSYSNLAASIAEDRASATPSLYQFDVPATAGGAGVVWTSAPSRLRWTAGADVQWIDGETREDFNYSSSLEEFQRRRIAGGANLLGGTFLQLLLDRGAWDVFLAGRLDAWKNMSGERVETNRQTGETTLELDIPDRTEATFNPAVGVVYHASDDVSLRGGVYRGFRAPTLNELYKPFRASGGVVTEANAELEPERLTGADLGIDVAPSAAVLARATVFWNEVDNLASQVTIGTAEGSGRSIPPCGFVSAGGTCRQRQNLGRLRSRGLELEAEFRPAARWILWASYLLGDNEIVSAPDQPQLEGKSIVQVPRHQMTATVTFADPALFDATLQARYIGTRYDDDLNSLEIDEMSVVDVKLRRLVASRWEVSLGIENLFDEEYPISRSNSGLVRVGPPRQVHGGIRVRL